MDAQVFLDAAILQDSYSAAQKSGKLSKKKMCEICIPFRDKYELTDLETLKIARNEYSLSELIKVLKL